MDDPVSANDANGLFGLPLVKIGWNVLKNPDIANGSEIQGDIDKLEEKARNGTITEEEKRRLKQQRQYLEKWEEKLEEEEFKRQQIAPRDPHHIRR